MDTIINKQALDFNLPKELECAIPTEERGISRDAVKLLVSEQANNTFTHTVFSELTKHLHEGDVLVVNTSGTLPAALPIWFSNGEEGRMHLSTRLSESEWLVEIRKVEGDSTIRLHDAKIGKLYHWPESGEVNISSAFYEKTKKQKHLKLWKAKFDLPMPMEEYLSAFGRPIRYSNVHNDYPLSYYQTVFANEPGSAEMPSAGRAFTTEMIKDLVLKGVQFAPITLHTGVSSLELDEQPFPEYFRVSAFTASVINLAKAEGRRVIAVGTTAIRAIESAVNKEGEVAATEGMTNLFITPLRGLNIVTGLLTGFHEPRASHLLMMEALAEREHLKLSYEAAIANDYQWHEFGDLHLLI